MDRHADDNHARIFHQFRRASPVLFFQNAHLVARKRQHFFKQTPHLARTAHNHHRRSDGQRVLKPLSFSLE
jgi:hypothetical protein